MLFYMKMERKQSGFAVAIRMHYMKKFKMIIAEVEFHFVTIKLERGNKTRSIASMYMQIAEELDVCGGGFNFRGTREDWNITSGDKRRRGAPEHQGMAVGKDEYI